MRGYLGGRPLHAVILPRDSGGGVVVKGQGSRVRGYLRG